MSTPKRQLQNVSAKMSHPKRHCHYVTSKMSHPKLHLQNFTSKMSPSKCHLQNINAKTSLPKHQLVQNIKCFLLFWYALRLDLVMFQHLRLASLDMSRSEMLSPVAEANASDRGLLRAVIRQQGGLALLNNQQNRYNRKALRMCALLNIDIFGQVVVLDKSTIWVSTLCCKSTFWTSTFLR